jgi:hypothetical protein
MTRRMNMHSVVNHVSEIGCRSRGLQPQHGVESVNCRVLNGVLSPHVTPTGVVRWGTQDSITFARRNRVASNHKT